MNHVTHNPPPARIESEEQLDALLSEPTPLAIETLAKFGGDLILLGVAGKMGPTLARMAKRAFDVAGMRHRVIGVSRFSTAGSEAQFHAHGIETIRCDLLDETAVRQLPEAPNVIYMAGMKFGSTGQEATTWAMNSYLPGIVCERYRRSRMVAFSTGNIYGLVPVNSGGSLETDAPNPVGEYAMSCLGRERVLEYFSPKAGIPMAIIRLNYACELRYGVLVDVAQQIFAGQPVDVSMGYLNTIWQADANAMTLCAFAQAQSPACFVNLTGPELVRVRDVAERFGRLLNQPVTLRGSEAANALLSNASKTLERYGQPRVSVEQLTAWIADWVGRGGRSLGKPTHFESRDGKF
ncbi:MAG: NAD-dependent epimerase/dehydratase family protein [Verrucomicrobiota bacterium]